MKKRGFWIAFVLMGACSKDGGPSSSDLTGTMNELVAKADDILGDVRIVFEQTASDAIAKLEKAAGTLSEETKKQIEGLKKQIAARNVELKVLMDKVGAMTVDELAAAAGSEIKSRASALKTELEDLLKKLRGFLSPDTPPGPPSSTPAETPSDR